MSRQRSLGAAWMIVFLLWLPFEDTNVGMSAFLATALCAWLALRLSGKLRGNLFLTTGLGAILPLLAIGLMAFKSGLHAHGFADFTLRQMYQVLSFTPVTAITGFLLFALSQRFLSNRGFVSK
jgi:hypothetical protein